MPSNLVATVLQDYISSYGGRMDANENRPSSYGALNLFKKQTGDANSILDPEVKANIEKSFNNTVKVPVTNYQDVTIGAARSCNLQTGGLTSALVTLTAVTYTFGVLAYPMQHYENFLSYQTALNKQIDAGLIKLAAAIDAACVNVLETYKNQYLPQAILDYYPQTGNALRVPQASKNDLYNQIPSILGTMDFPSDNLDILCNNIAMSDVRRYAAQGAGNSTNLSFQLLGHNWFPTNRVTNGSVAIQSTLFGVVPGSVAVQSRNSPEAKQGMRIHDSKYWDIFPNAPHIGMDLDVFYQAECADASAVQASGMAANTQTKVESWQFAVDVFYMRAYNSAIATRYSPIQKIEVTVA
jgi:hypothetical protein